MHDSMSDLIKRLKTLEENSVVLDKEETQAISFMARRALASLQGIYAAVNAGEQVSAGRLKEVINDLEQIVAKTPDRF